MSKRSSKPANTNPYPLWAPRFWHGMLFTDWIRLLAKNRFRVHPLRWALASTVTIASTFNTKMRLAQLALMGHEVGKTPVPDDPVFILGHWRSGTTFLHELLSVDDRFATPTTYQCFAANHFLLTERVMTRLLWFLMPSQRPMDNVAAGWHAPQEDEFALCAKGVPSPYLRMSFPNDSTDEYLEYLDLEGIGPHELQAWRAALNDFLRQLTVHYQDKRIVLKSPTHTGRIGVLAAMFPRAKFIHMIRDPYDVVPSTLRLWKSLDEVQGLQIPRYEHTEDYVHRAYQRMYGGFFGARERLGDERIIDIRYESFVENTCAELRRAYEHLELGDFARVRDKLTEAVAAKKGYRKNTHALDPVMIANINQHWHDYFKKFEYEMRASD